MFNQLNLSEWILNALEAKSFVVPTEIQQTCIPLIAEGKDIVGRSKTGSGKTFAFGLPAIDKVDTQLKSIQILVVCPTRELALQVTDELRKITEFKEGCGIVPIYGGADIERQIRALKGGKIAVGTPGRLMDHMRRGTLKLHNLKMAVLDEADEMLNMGFRDDIESILKATPKSRQTVMFSATMPTAIKAITREYMIEPQYVEIGELNSTIDKIDQSYIRVSRTGKKAALIELFEKLSPERSIVFCNTKRMVDDIKGLLSGKGIDCLALHGDMRQSERKRVMESIKSHKVSTLVATDVAARGIDIEDVAYIFNFDLPNDVEYYIHRIGRTARAGKSGKA
ncbi:MAG: DEAD/DEAH box helicase, partial [Clostridia bacterium]|nr:DEAD/DEAH box helicase [Clostridia bacterium]